MGIFDEMENFIIDHFSVTKRHNVQQTIEISNRNAGHQLPGLASSEQVSRSGPGGQVSQHNVSLTHSDQNRPSERTPPNALRLSSSGIGNEPPSSASGDPLNWTDRAVRNEDGQQLSSQAPPQSVVAHRYQHTERDVTQTSPFFRELLSWGERTSNTMGLHEQQRNQQTSENESHIGSQVERTPFRSPQLERVSFRSPQLSRFHLPSSPVRTHRTSWVEQSNISARSPGTRRSFSFEQVSSPPGPRRTSRITTSSERPRNSHCEALPPTPPLRQEKEVQRTTPQSENLPPNSPFRTERPRFPSTPSSPCLPPGRNSPSAQCPLQLVHETMSPQSENKINLALSGESPPSPRQPQSSGPTLTSMASRGNLQDNSSTANAIRVVSKPKLIRLRSEPCSPSFASGNEDINCCSAHSAGIMAEGGGNQRTSRRRREELRRSQSFESRSSSCQEALWMGINMPSQLVITRPQLCRARLNRKHLSLHLEGLTGDLNSLRASPPLQFHDVHGDNIELLCNKSRARRHESFCKGICFSNRPININERVYVKFVETNTSWSGVLRFGFTSVNPASLRGADLPRYACPDLTNKPGNWAKALGERYTASNILLHFSVNRAGDVNYGVNGEEKGLFFSGVATDQPVWAMLDIYGNTVGVEFSHANAEIEPGHFDASPVPSGPDVFNFNSLSLDEPGGRNVGGSTGPTVVMTPHSPSTPPGLNTQGAPLLQYHTGINFNPLPFHNLVGRNIRVSADRRVALRMPDEYCNAYVFTGRPISCGETVVLQVLSIDRSFIGGLGFGLTACDPSTVDPSSLPDDSDHLLDRLEYWVVNKDVCRNPEVGDEISFFLSDSGEVKYARNNQAPVTLMHVDRTLPLWAFFDVYGNIQRVHLVGSTTTLVQGRLARSQSMATSRLVTGSPNNINPPPLRSNSVPGQCLPSPQEPNLRPFMGDSHLHQPPRIGNTHMHPHPQQLPHRPPQQPMSAPCTPLGMGERGAPDELAMDCKVCWEQSVNCVLYTCGHMCLCFDCAVKIRSQNGLCPICRQAIVDVIKTYRS